MVQSPSLKGSARSATSQAACSRDSGEPGEAPQSSSPSASDRARVCTVERHLHAAAPKRRVPILQRRKLRIRRYRAHSESVTDLGVKSLYITTAKTLKITVANLCPALTAFTALGMHCLISLCQHLQGWVGQSSFSVSLALSFFFLQTRGS